MWQALAIAISIILLLPSAALGYGHHPTTRPPKAERRVLIKKTPVKKQRQHFRAKMVKGATNYLGVSEQPNGSNSGRMVRVFLRHSGLSAGYAWCSSFVWYVVDNWGMYSGNHPSNMAYVPSVEYWARKHNATVSRSNALPGMAVTVNGGGHIAIIIKRIGNMIITIGGNESDRVKKTIRTLQSVNQVIDFARAS